MQNITPIGLLSAAIRRERERLNLSVTELAKRAGIAKSTLSQLEAGSGNPSLETLWALAMALDVPVSRLISQPSRQVQVIRAHEGTPALSEQGNYAATLLATCPPGAQRDIYRLRVQPGEAKLSLAASPRHRRACDHQQRARAPGAGGPAAGAERRRLHQLLRRSRARFRSAGAGDHRRDADRAGLTRALTVRLLKMILNYISVPACFDAGTGA